VHLAPKVNLKRVASLCFAVPAGGLDVALQAFHSWQPVISCLSYDDLSLRAVVDFGESRLFKRWPSTSQQSAVTIAPDTMWIDHADTVDDDAWVSEGSAAALAAEREVRGEHLPSKSTCERVRDLAVQL
jgi:hypothetical protein